MAPRGILKPPSVFPLEHELPAYEEPRRARSRSRSRDRRHVDEALVVVHSSGSKSGRERHVSARSSQRTERSRRRSKSRSRRHIRWSDPVAFVVSDGTDLLALRQLRHRRSSLPSILEDTRTIYQESLRENEKNRRSDKDSSRHPPDTFHPSASSSSSHKRPSLKATLSTPNVARPAPSPRAPETLLHAPTPISHEHRRRRISLPDGLEAAVKSPSHALWLPHHSEDESDERSTHRSSRHSTHLAAPSAPHSNEHGHSRAASYSHLVSTPRRYDAQLPPHVREQPHLRGSSVSAPPPVTFTSQHPSAAGRPISQVTTSSHRSSKSSPPEKASSFPTPPMANSQEMEPQTPKSTRSNLLAFPTVDDIFGKDETSHSMLSVRRLFGLSTPKHEPRGLDDEKPVKKSKHSREPSKESMRKDGESEGERRRTASFVVNPPTREPLHRTRHSFDLGTFSLLDDMHMRWTAATARHFLPVMTPAEIRAAHLKPTLNPSLATIHWDIRHPPSAVWSVVPGRKTTLWKGHNEPAVVPLVPSLRVLSPYFPWVINARNPAGVTCGDVLSAIHTSARQLVWRGEFDQLRQADKDRLAAGYHANRPGKGKPQTADTPFEAGSWLVRADWLGRHTVLRGISTGEARDKHGTPVPDILLTMYLGENRREGDKQALVLRRH